MKQLTITEIVPYLPYNTLIANIEYEYGEPKPIKSAIFLTPEIVHNLISFPKTRKLILRNLSDLTKEIEHNEERFVPITKLTGVEDLSVFEITDRYIKLPKARYSGKEITDWVLNLDKVGILLNPYIAIQRLIEWHFDIFSLIDNGLAVDYNTVNK